MSLEPQESGARRRAPARGRVAQGVGAAGAALAVALAVAVALARGRALERVDEIAARVDLGIARGAPLFVAAREQVDGIATLVDSVADAARRRAKAGATSDAREALLERVALLSERYRALRAAYADARERVVAVLDRLHTLDRALPAITVPQGPVDALAGLDETVRHLDQRVAALLDAGRGAATGGAAAAVVDRVDPLRTTLERVSAGLDDAGSRLTALRAEASGCARTVRTAITWASLLLALALLYAAFLHVVLYRSGARARREPPGST